LFVLFIYVSYHVAAYLLQEWEASKSGSVLGKMKFRNSNTANGSTSLSKISGVAKQPVVQTPVFVMDKVPSASGFPVEYKLEKTSDFSKNMAVFRSQKPHATSKSKQGVTFISDESGTRRISSKAEAESKVGPYASCEVIHTEEDSSYIGTISYVGQLNPLRGPDFVKFLQDLKPVQQQVGQTITASTGTTLESLKLEQEAAKRRLIAQQQEKELKKLDKKVKEPKQIVIDKLYEKFALKQHISLRDLTEMTNQPKEYLKEILDQICDRHTSGEFKDTYSLKSSHILKLSH
jgi:hypothetical protein